GAATQQSRKCDQDDCAYCGGRQSPDEAVGADAELAEEPAADRSADQPHKHVRDQPESPAPHDFATKPSRNQSDQDPHKELVTHKSPLECNAGAASPHRSVRTCALPPAPTLNVGCSRLRMWMT